MRFDILLQLDILGRVANLSRHEYVGIVAGERVRAPRRLRYRIRDQVISNGIADLDAGRINIRNFLMSAANHFDPEHGLPNAEIRDDVLNLVSIIIQTF